MSAAEDLFGPRDRAQLAARGVTLEDARQQVRWLRRPPPAIVLDRPCTVGDGIVRLPAAEQEGLRGRAEAAAGAGRVTKLVPASGAATRMFKDLIAAQRDRGRPPSASATVRELLGRLDSFAFAEELRRLARVPGRPASEEEERRLLDALLDEMGYAALPKGLVAFHRADRARTAFEDQLVEGTRYARAADGRCRMHFTVSPGFRVAFEETLERLRPEVERRCRCRLLVGFSEQLPSTDTLALDAAGQPFRTADGSLLFRPAGHGALLTNLQRLGGDLVVLKNIDNVLPEEAGGEAVGWKRVLIGFLVRLQEEVFEELGACAAEDAPEARLDRAIDLAATRFCRRPAAPLRGKDEKRRFVRRALDRPLRVCGVVRNEGEPGGAPFWVRDAEDGLSVQIVESAQVAPGDAGQSQVFRSATHFNPVDVVAGLRRWNGEPFDLFAFVDPAAVLVSDKSHEGRELRALERPGLWNGAMARWNTVCVEVPGSTFAPVKTVLDLLRPEHQVQAAVSSASR